jgi:hypothetical protein
VTNAGVMADAELQLEISDGIMLVGSDGHYWPGSASTGHKAFVRFIKELKPKIVIYNGEAFDGARISRHPPNRLASSARRGSARRDG